MEQATLDTMQEVGCVYLAQIGGCCQLSTQAVVQTKEKIWEDMAANVVIKHEFKDLGPLICCMDAKGNSLFANVNEQVIKNKEEIFANLK
jgi:fumarate hydratase subunit beta